MHRLETLSWLGELGRLHSLHDGVMRLHLVHEWLLIMNIDMLFIMRLFVS